MVKQYTFRKSEMTKHRFSGEIYFRRVRFSSSCRYRRGRVIETQMTCSEFQPYNVYYWVKLYYHLMAMNMLIFGCLYAELTMDSMEHMINW